jgi:hypothetical protein
VGAKDEPIATPEDEMDIKWMPNTLLIDGKGFRTLLERPSWRGAEQTVLQRLVACILDDFEVWQVDVSTGGRLPMGPEISRTGMAPSAADKTGEAPSSKSSPPSVV